MHCLLRVRVSSAITGIVGLWRLAGDESVELRRENKYVVADCGCEVEEIGRIRI
jgi:hypothetical protein